MNRLEILAPRWHDRKVLIADWKIGRANQIVIKDKNFPEPFYATGEELKAYPIQTIKTKSGNMVNMRVVPLDELTSTEIIENL